MNKPCSYQSMFSNMNTTCCYQSIISIINKACSHQSILSITNKACPSSIYSLNYKQSLSFINLSFKLWIKLVLSKLSFQLWTKLVFINLSSQLWTKLVIIKLLLTTLKNNIRLSSTKEFFSSEILLKSFYRTYLPNRK